MNALRNATSTATVSFARLLLLALAMTAPAHAHRPAPSPVPVELEIIDRHSGRRLPTWHHQGQAWVAGEPGQAYAIALRNRSEGRVLVVLSVDGINAIDGRSADPGQAGYVLGPGQMLEVTGWRKSLGSVARFVFDDPARSYAARTGRPDNIGVVGVAVFREQRAHRPPPHGIASARGERDGGGRPATPAQAVRRAADGEYAERAAGADAGVRVIASAAREPRLGTGHGAVEGSQAYYTGFEREAVPVQVQEVRYDTRAGLRARGIAVAPPPWRIRRQAPVEEPRAFPGGFVPDPR